MTGELFLPGASFLHLIDHRARLLALAALVAVFLVPSEPLLALLYDLALALLIAWALGPRELARPLRAIAPALFFIVLLTPPFTREGRTLVAVIGFPLVTTGGVRATLFFLARFVGITLSFYGLLRTVRIEELVQALRWYGLPFRASLVITITFRYIPFIAATWQNVRDAHRLRAAGGPSGRRPRLAQRWIPALSSVLIQAVKAIPALAMALECRGFGRHGPRSSLVHPGPWGRFLLHSLGVALLASLLLALALVRSINRIFAVPGL